VIVLHGAGGTPGGALGLLDPCADGHGLMVFAPQSADRTWSESLTTPHVISPHVHASGITF
jgi:poly(3-hydroxybutyrate) depolymerase